MDTITKRYALMITGENNAPLVSVLPNGKIEMGDGYEPDEAARIFWLAMRNNYPSEFTSPFTDALREILKACQAHPTSGLGAEVSEIARRGLRLGGEDA